MSLRSDIARRAQLLSAPTDVSIISDDCWGGQYYRSLRLPYLTPTVGCWIEPAHYLAFVRHLADDGALRVQKMTVEKAYPVLETKHARLHFIHDHDPQKTAESFERRSARLNFSQLCFKIDFGKGYRHDDVEAWNALALPRSVALYPTGFDGAQRSPVHHGVEVADWTLDGLDMYYLSRRHFDLIQWLRTGLIEKRAWKQPLYTLFADPLWKQVIRNGLRRPAVAAAST